MGKAVTMNHTRGSGYILVCTFGGADYESKEKRQVQLLHLPEAL
jgi:hypothetical protein